MHPRNNILEIFSTFLEFADDRFRGWVSVPKLRRSMQNALQQSPQECSDNFWALFWYNKSQLNQIAPLAKEHLIAYLQEPCYWASQKVVVNFATSQYKLSDCFQIAIAQVDKVFKGFNPKEGFIFKNYAKTVFSSAIRETLRQRQEIDICTDWGLLRKISQKRLVEALQADGWSADAIAVSVIVWNCFKLHYVPTPGKTARQLSRPDNQTWEAIAKAYYSQTHQQSNSQTLETYLLNSAKATRRYLYPNITSIPSTPNDSEDFGDSIAHLPASVLHSPLNQMIAEEEQQAQLSQQFEINQFLASAIAQLEVQTQQILQLYYNQGLTQQQIAQQLDIQQYTVSRRLTKTKETLLRSLANWSQEKLHISVTSDILKTTSALIEEWLQAHYRQ